MGKVTFSRLMFATVVIVSNMWSIAAAVTEKPHIDVTAWIWFAVMMVAGVLTFKDSE